MFKMISISVFSFIMGAFLTSMLYQDQESKFYPVLFVLIGMFATVLIINYTIERIEKLTREEK